MIHHTYPAARLVVVGRVLSRTERETAWLATPEGAEPEGWVLDVIDADPRITL